METNKGPEKRVVNEELSHPQGVDYESYMEQQKKVAGALSEFIKKNSERIIRQSNEQLGAYAIESIVFPAKEEYLFNSRPVYEQVAEILHSEQGAGLDPMIANTLLQIAEYTRSAGFIDDAVDDNQRDAVQRYLSDHSIRTPEEQDMYAMYKNDKFQAQKISSILKIVSLAKAPLFVLGKDLRLGDTITHVAEKIRREISSDKNDKGELNYKDYEKMTNGLKYAVVKLTTELAREICARFIESRSSVEAKA